MYRTTPALIAVVAVLFLGCAAKETGPVTYDPPARFNDLGADLAAAETSVPADGYRVLISEGTKGRFACDVAIAKFARSGSGDEAGVSLITPTSAEQAYWAQRFRGVQQIRALTFLTPKSVRLDGDGAESICAAAAGLGAPLLVAYTRSITGPNAANAVGVVYRTSDAAVLATLRAQGDGPDTVGGGRTLDEAEGDYREVDARFQTQRRLEDHAFECVRDLVHVDAPPPTTQPHDWQQPFVERWWMRSRR